MLAMENYKDVALQTFKRLDIPFSSGIKTEYLTSRNILLKLIMF